MFISYLTSAANDICKEAKRQTISAEDVFSALQDLEFGELLPPLKEALDGIAERLHPLMCAVGPAHCAACSVLGGAKAIFLIGGYQYLHPLGHPIKAIPTCMHAEGVHAAS